MSSEFERISRLAARFQSPRPEVLLGIGDDCAVLAPSASARVWTVDSAVEDVHFSRVFMASSAIGYRSFMAAASDIAAMGARCIGALSALTLPPGFDDEQLDALSEGIARAASACACPVIGGNLARGRELSLTTTVLGECRAEALTRRGARVGDGIFVTGTLGGAALGLRALERGLSDDGRFASSIARFLAPHARLDLAAAIASCAHAAIDVSDGLMQDLAHLCEASGVGARISAEALPALPSFDAQARALELTALHLQLAGGEDYELLFTAAQDSVDPALATCIGEIEPVGGGVRVLDPSGTPIVHPQGFDHFVNREARHS